MQTTARVVFEVLFGIFLAHSMGLLFLDAQVLGIYGVWGMVIARTEGWRRAVGEVAALALLGVAIVNVGLGAPVLVTPRWFVLAGVVALWVGLALVAVRWPVVWLPWVIGVSFWWGPPQLFLPEWIWAMAILSVAIAKLKSSSS